MGKIKEVVEDNQPEDDSKLEAFIKKCHSTVKSKVTDTEDTWLRGEIAKVEKATPNQLNTADFRKYFFRQGAAREFPELDEDKDKVEQSKEEDKDQEETENAEPHLRKHFQKSLRADLVRWLMIAKTKETEGCNWELDYPKFETACKRAFAIDMSARGKYDHNSPGYNRIKAMIELFIKTWSDT